MKKYLKPVFVKTQFISSDSISSGLEDTFGSLMNPEIFPDLGCTCSDLGCVVPCDSCGNVISGQ